MGRSLINTADLRALVESNAAVEAIARTPESVEGFLFTH